MSIRVRDREPASSYHLVLACLGYEPRCVHVASLLSDCSEVKLASSFDSEHMLAFDTNKMNLEGLGFEVVPHSSKSINDFLAERLRGLVAVGDITVAVDISSITRDRLARVLLAIVEFAKERSVYVDFWYSPPKFDPNVSKDPTIQIAEPILPEFSGMAADPLLPVTAIIGVGFEPNLALGVAEYLDVSRVYAFVPTGHDSQFDREVAEGNAAFFRGRSVVSRSEYDVYRPFELFARLESLTYGLAQSQRVCLVPLGPKLFGLCAMLAALRSESPIAVWRFSSGGEANLRSSEHCDRTITLSVDFDGR